MNKPFIALALIAAPANAQTLEQRIDKIILDANQAKNANARVEAEAKRLKADIATVAAPVVVTPPVPPPVVVVHDHTSLLPVIDITKIPVVSAGFDTARIKADTVSTPRATGDGTGQFRTVCTFSHMNFDDPIVVPNKQGMSHLHTFFGNRAVNYASTQASIETTGSSTCSGGTANRTGYWVPAVIDTKDGTPIAPDSVMIYYKTGYIEGDNVRPFPAGLRMITGDMRSTAPQVYNRWLCTSPSGDKQTGHDGIPADCPVGYTITASANFPFCWDGVNLDSPDHKSHMSWHVWNGQRSVCPSTHPVELPMITENIKYIVKEAGAPARWRLSSDNYGTDKPGGYSLHADWFNGWDAKVQALWVKNCLQANKDCGVDVLGDGTRLF